jgi:hypothetical protein
LDIFIQEKDLAQVTDPNCLPSPNGQFFLVMRMSWPDMKKANGTPVKLAG